MGCTSSGTGGGATEVVSAQVVDGEGCPPQPQGEPARVEFTQKPAAPPEPAEPSQPSQPSAPTAEARELPELPGYPACVRVAFERADLGGGDVGTLLGVRCAEACQVLGSELGVAAAALNDALGAPRLVDADGNPPADLGSAKFPVAFEFPISWKYHLLVGLRGAGKSTMLQRLASNAGRQIQTLEGLELFRMDDGASFACWSLPCTIPVERFASMALSVTLVVDGTDGEKLEEAAAQLRKLLEAPGLEGRPLLVFANKKDLPGSMEAATVTERLGLAQLGRPCFVQSSCAPSGDGVFPGLGWLAQKAAALPAPQAKADAALPIDVLAKPRAKQRAAPPSDA